MKLTPTVELIQAILERIPEGFISREELAKRVQLYKKSAMDQMLSGSFVVRHENFYLDTTRLTIEKFNDLVTWCKPELPPILKDGWLPDRPITERLIERQKQLEQSHAPKPYIELLYKIQNTPGYIKRDELITHPDLESILDDLLQVSVLAQLNYIVYDPLRLSQSTIQEILRLNQLQPQREHLLNMLAQSPMHQRDLIEIFGDDQLQSLIQMGGLATFTIPTKFQQYNGGSWIYLKSMDVNLARKLAQKVIDQALDDAWGQALALCYDMLRTGAKDGATNRAQVVARTYSINQAAQRLNLRKETIRKAMRQNILSYFIDPEGAYRIHAKDIELALQDDEQLEQITAFEIVRARDLMLLCNRSYSTIRRRLKRLKHYSADVPWGLVRGMWELPDQYHIYKTRLLQINEEQRRKREAEKAERLRIIREQQEAERRRREELRARLVAAFPTWKHDARIDQQITLHVGPPNSGKTHDALNTLTQAGSGWYLAPLRLLAFEIFDRLNQRGVPCNLLTGEEYIPVEGACITAATIEMFNPTESGECVVIDEAQMLADSDRGWAWTQAMMQARSPQIHVIAPDIAETLITRLANEAAIPIDIVRHKRLTPIQFAERHIALDELPKQTILVAFSRKMVLHLKTELEDMGRRVSVVYGSLPPEVRRRQADRFASGETEICVATDAVGMGLNLPADRVVFYEIEKFDGTDVRLLNPSEVQQIGGRAGRYGYAESGEVAAVRRGDHDILRKLFYEELKPLTYARVAPSVEDLMMIPGSLHERLQQWASLQSIPDSLRDIIKTADMTERIELAAMLTDQQVNQLGLDAALKLVNAPTRQSSRAYWHNCAMAIIQGGYMPKPPAPPRYIKSSVDLETAEDCIACADVYLWLGSRREFQAHAADMMEIREARLFWSSQIDDALLQKIDTLRRCRKCGRRLPRNHRFALCDRCFYAGKDYDYY
ncbi:MAG: hypothetical protein Kow00117_07170 [Phototrophicales bacterium]